MYIVFGLLLILLAGNQQGELVQGVDDVRKDDARFGTMGRSLLQSVHVEEIISMSMTGCDPSQGTGACGPSFQEECEDYLPTNATLECSDYVKLNLCGEIAEEFCKASCNRCPQVCEDVLVPFTKDCTIIVDGNKCDDPEIKGIYCQKSCGQCQPAPPPSTLSTGSQSINESVITGSCYSAACNSQYGPQAPISINFSGNSAEIYQSPSFNSKIVGYLTRPDTIRMMCWTEGQRSSHYGNDEWVRVCYKGNTAYMHDGTLSCGGLCRTKKGLKRC